MYFYYFLMAIRCKPKWFNPQVSRSNNQALFEVTCFFKILLNTCAHLPFLLLTIFQWITAMQLAQMFAGTILSVLAFVTMVREGDNCWSKPRNNMASLLMYGSYFFLFLQFFFTKYAVRAKPSDKAKKSD